MDPKNLTNPQDLHDYLKWLEERCATQGKPHLAQALKKASQFISGSSTEFLGESRIALEALKRNQANLLSQSESDDLNYVLDQINKSGLES